LDGEWLSILIGAIIGILASIVGYFVNYLLKLKEQRFVREFEIREKGREFYHQVYGIVAVLTEFVTSFLQDENSDKAMVLIEKGYASIPKKDIIRRYRKAFKAYSAFWCEARGKGLEVFVNKELKKKLEKFWGYAGYFYEKDGWAENKEIISAFEKNSQEFIDIMDGLLGLREKQSILPKWLNHKNWHIILWSGKSDRN
jgi:hypothetical protein